VERRNQRELHRTSICALRQGAENAAAVANAVARRRRRKSASRRRSRFANRCGGGFSAVRGGFWGALCGQYKPVRKSTPCYSKQLNSPVCVPHQAGVAECRRHGGVRRPSRGGGAVRVRAAFHPCAACSPIDLQRGCWQHLLPVGCRGEPFASIFHLPSPPPSACVRVASMHALCVYVCVCICRPLKPAIIFLSSRCTRIKVQSLA